MPSHPEKKRVRKLPAKAADMARKRGFGKQGALKRRKAVTAYTASVPKRKKR